MSSHDPRSPGRGDDPDADLRALIADAVEDVEPSDRLAAIRAAAGPAAADPTPSDHPEKVTPMNNRRSWIYAATGAAVATAAVLAAIAFAGGDLGGGDDPGPVAATQGTPSPSEEAPDEPDDPGDPATATSPEPSPTADEPSPEPPVRGEMTVPVYYTGDGPAGPVLYREFHRAPVSDGSDVRLTAAAREAVAGAPLDPDYRSDWPDVDVRQVNLIDGTITVDLTDAPSRPSGLSAREADLAVQQVVYTVQAAAQKRSAVRFTVGGRPVDSVLGVDTAQPVGNRPILETVSRMIITSPFEGQEVSGGAFQARGANNSFEATVAWELRDGSGGVVKQGAGIAEGYMAEELFAWSVRVDLGGVSPGEYTFVAMNDDPSGREPASDTRTVVVR